MTTIHQLLNINYAFSGDIKFPLSMVSARLSIPLLQIVNHWLCNQRDNITDHMGHQMSYDRIDVSHSIGSLHHPLKNINVLNHCHTGRFDLSPGF